MAGVCGSPRAYASGLREGSGWASEVVGHPQGQGQFALHGFTLHSRMAGLSTCGFTEIFARIMGRGQNQKAKLPVSEHKGRPACMRRIECLKRAM